MSPQGLYALMEECGETSITAVLHYIRVTTERTTAVV